MNTPIEHIYNRVNRLSELEYLGYSPKTVASSLRDGSFIKIKQGVYVPAAEWSAWSDRDRCFAHHVAHAKTAQSGVFSHQSAALWYSAPLLHLPRKMHLSYPHQTTNYKANITAHRGRPEECASARNLLGVLVTSPAQTLIDVACALPRLDALVIADCLLRRGLLGLDEASRVLRSLEKPKANLVADRLSAVADSPAETIARDLIHTWKLPLPEAQFVIATASGARYRADFAWPTVKVILEVDGEIKYSGDYGSPDEVIRAELRRQRELEASGWNVIRVRWKELTQHPASLRQRLWVAGVR